MRWSDMKKTITWAAVVALLLSWSLMFPFIALAVVKFLDSYKPNYYDDIDEHGSEFR
jgi:hypothetical protein